MKLRISRKKRTAAKLLYQGGIAVILLSILACAVSPELWVWILIGGAVMGFAGEIWVGRLYRCPQCGRKLLGRGWEAFTLTTYNHCPNCGWAVDIEYTD